MPLISRSASRVGRPRTVGAAVRFRMKGAAAFPPRPHHPRTTATHNTVTKSIKSKPLTLKVILIATDHAFPSPFARATVRWL